MFPLSHGREALYFIHQVAPENSVYHIPISYHVFPELNIQTLQEALRAIMERHPSLRTVFDAGENGQLRQRVLNDQPLDFAEIDASPLYKQNQCPSIVEIVVVCRISGA